MDRHLAIQCFCRVVETGSLAAAARDLDCSRSAVTKYVQFLEDWTASRLLERTTRAMQLTEAGERFYAYCRRVLADTEQTLTAIAADRAEVSGRLVVAAPVSMTLACLAEHLQAFMQAYPAVQLDVRLSDEVVDLIREGVDVALRGQAQLDDSSLVAVPVMQFERMVCASPAYWQAHGHPERPEDLAHHNCLPYLLSGDATRWQFIGPDGSHEVPVQGNFRADNSLLLVDAMCRGLGVGLVPAVMMRRELQAGLLVPTLTSYRLEPRQLFAVYPSRDHLPERVRAFVRFLKARLSGAGH